MGAFGWEFVDGSLLMGGWLGVGWELLDGSLLMGVC